LGVPCLRAGALEHNMKKKLLVGLLIFFALFLSFVYLFLPFKGKDLVVNKLKFLTGRDVALGHINYIPPFKFKIDNLNIQGLFKADSILISPGIEGLFSGKFLCNEINFINPEIICEKKLPVKTESAAADLLISPAKTVISTTGRKNNGLNFMFRRITVSNGKIDIIDLTAGPEEGVKITIKDISLNLTNIHKMPLSVISNFDFKGSIPWEKGRNEGVIAAHGWIDLFKKDINAVLKIEGIDGVYLSPYYSSWIDIHKARIEYAKLDFISNIHGLNNNVSAQCHLELSDIVFKPRLPEETQEKEEKIMHTVLDIFKSADQGKVSVDFTFKTKMDRPEFGFQIIKGALEDKIANSKKSSRQLTEDIILLPASILQGAVKSAADISKAVIDGSFAVGNEFKKALQASFKK